MPKKLLVENYQPSKLFEDVSDSKKPGVLKTIKGPVADFKENRNHRVYPRQLWENVINSEYVQEMMSNSMLLGEADHPEERTEISIQNVSHAINKLWINEETQEVWGELDILETPLGELVSHLLEYGSNIGVSSRGAGTVLEDGTVDPDDYQFFTFDLVARPSVAAARPSVVESEEFNLKSLSESEIRSIVDSYASLQEKNNECPIDIYETGRESLIETVVSSQVLNSKLLNNKLED